MSKHKYDFTIAYADTDAEGIVYNARYLEIADRVCMNWLRGKNIPQGDGFIIKKLGGEYCRPLKLGDDVCVETEVLKVGNAFVDTMQYFLNRKKAVCALLSSRIVYAGSDLRIKYIPDELRKEMMGVMEKQR